MGGQMIDNKDILKDLVVLTGRTVSGLALEAGIDAGNLSRFLKGHQTVSEIKIKKVYDILGIVNDALSLEKVHNWTVKSGDLLPLARILSREGISFEMAYLIPSPLTLKNQLEFYRRPLLIRSISSPPLRIVFHRRPRLILPENQFQKEEVVLVQSGIAEWRKIPRKYLYPTIPADKNTYDHFYSGTDIMVEEFDRVWNSVNEKNPKGEEKVLWDALIKKAREAGISPSEASQRLGLGEIDE
jgi:hypothetical protein